jgi:hypothetical protein
MRARSACELRALGAPAQAPAHRVAVWAWLRVCVAVCSVTCGTGTQMMKLQCFSSTGGIVADSFCDGNYRGNGASVTPCAMQDCPARCDSYVSFRPRGLAAMAAPLHQLGWRCLDEGPASIGDRAVQLHGLTQPWRSGDAADVPRPAPGIAAELDDRQSVRLVPRVRHVLRRYRGVQIELGHVAVERRRTYLYGKRARVALHPSAPI